jgi:putative sterol carrier protein
MSTSSTIEKTVQAMAQGLQSQKAAGLTVTYQLQLTGDGGGVWTVSIAGGKCSVSRGAPPRADTTITMSTDAYLKLAAGQLNVMDAYHKGQVAVKGNTGYALKFAELFPPWAALVPPDAPPTPPATPPPASPQPTPPPTTPAIADYVQAMPKGFRPDKAGGLRVTYQFQLTGATTGTWTVAVADRTCTVTSGQTAPPSVAITMSESDFVKLAQGQLNTTDAYRQGKVKINGDLALAAKITDLFGPWAGFVGVTPTPTPAPTPSSPPSPQPPSPTPVNPTLLNGSFDDYQPYIRDGAAQFWKEPQFPERYGTGWTVVVISEPGRRVHLMDSEVFGKFTQKYFGGHGRDYHIHGTHSQVVTSRNAFDVVFMQTVAAQPGREYSFTGSIVSFYKGTSGVQMDGKIFKTIGIDPTGGHDYASPNVIWGERDGKDNAWRYPVVKAKAQANAITVFIRLENIEPDVGVTELNTIHLDNFRLE